MYSIYENTKRHFPVTSVDSVKLILKEELERDQYADLTLLSILIGYIENHYTKPCLKYDTHTLSTPENDEKILNHTSFPLIELDCVEMLQSKFVDLILTNVGYYKEGQMYACRNVIKKVSDVIWGSLAKSYFKDKAHLQSLYSYLTVSGKRLDCFGLAFSVVAGCQILGFQDVHLSLSEDHAWVVYGENGEQTAEVTWHGKGNEDKRGQPILHGSNAKSWLYANNHPVVCNRAMEIVAVISCINSYKTPNSNSVELEMLQQELLWFLYDQANLAELENLHPNLKSNHPSSLQLYQTAIKIAKNFYANQHVYPYTLLGSFYYHHQQFKPALQAWSNAADVIRQYNYSREDEEIYKEFLDIASDYLPGIMKIACSLTKDPECFALILNFFDGLCEWEEESVTPVLHIGWTKPLMGILVKFDADIRNQVIINLCTKSSPNEVDSIVENIESDILHSNKTYTHQMNLRCKRILDYDSELSLKREKLCDLYSNHSVENFPCVTQELLQVIETQDSNSQGLHPCISRLISACSENILNPEYLLGLEGSQPFTPVVPCSCHLCCSESQWENDVDINSNDFVSKTLMFPKATNGNLLKTVIDCPKLETKYTEKENFCLDQVFTKRPLLSLHSQKMIGLKDLLLSVKLNTQAISLQLTAQSQLHLGRR